MKVKATQKGFYAHSPRAIGDVFDIEKKEHFSKAWMEIADKQKKNIVASESINQPSQKIEEVVVEDKKEQDSNNNNKGKSFFKNFGKKKKGNR